MYHALIRSYLSLALIHFFPGIDYILLPFAVNLHKILIISTDEKCNRKKCCIHQPCNVRDKEPDADWNQAES